MESCRNSFWFAIPVSPPSDNSSPDQQSTQQLQLQLQNQLEQQQQRQLQDVSDLKAQLSRYKDIIEQQESIIQVRRKPSNCFIHLRYYLLENCNVILLGFRWICVAEFNPSLSRPVVSRAPVFNLGDMSPPGDILTFPKGHEVGYGVQKKYLV